jgi:hypothetical protein
VVKRIEIMPAPNFADREQGQNKKEAQKDHQAKSCGRLYQPYDPTVKIEVSEKIESRNEKKACFQNGTL